MDAKRRAVLMVAIFLGLLAFHGWLLYRVARAGNTVLAVLLAIAVGLFAWRIAHYAGRYRNGERAATVAQERRRIALIAPVLAALLPLHAWMISLTLSMADYVLTGVLVVSVAVFTARLAFYWRRYAGLRATA